MESINRKEINFALFIETDDPISRSRIFLRYVRMERRSISVRLGIRNDSPLLALRDLHRPR